MIVGDPDAEDARALVAVAHEGYYPSRVVLLRAPGDRGEPIAGLAPFTRDFVQIDGRATAYLCSGFACERPVTEADALRQLIRDA